MIPLRDNVPSRSTPIVNYMMIGICTLVFLNQLGESQDHQTLVEKYGMIPYRISHPNQPALISDYEIVNTSQGRQVKAFQREAVPSTVSPILTMLTCIFLHGGWMHFLGNMLFLYIFGDNVEDCFGHIGYMAFYLGCGALASFVHFISDPGSTVPTIGASGAIAGVMGGYFVLYPHARVLTLIPIIFFIQVIVVPAPVFLGLWFLLQLFQGTLSQASGAAGGVAWWAHIGGFLVGYVLSRMLSKIHVIRNPVHDRIPTRTGMFAYHPR